MVFVIGLGTVLNAAGIVLGGLLGMACGRFLSERVQQTLNMACGVSGQSVVMNVGTASAGYGFEYVVSTMDRVKAAALSQSDATLQMPIVTPVASEVWNVKEAAASEADMPEWGNQEERGVDMEIETAAAVLAAGSNAVILRHPESVKTISTLVKELV